MGEWLDALSGDLSFKRGYVSDLAERLDISQGQLSNAIAGRKVPKEPEVLLELSELIGVSVNDLFRIPPPEAQMARLRPYSKLYDLYVSDRPKRRRSAPVVRPKRQA